MASPPPLTIAIDGYSACGKSTLARALARRLGYSYIDTGAMYRAVTLQLQRSGVDLDDESAVASTLSETTIGFRPTDNHVLLNGVDVEDQIRGLNVSNMVSQVAALSQVRRAMVDQQRRMGADGGVILDGRDIGTVVFPDADLKLFVTADIETRIDRRLSELLSNGQEVRREEVAANLKERDHIDSSRADSPLRMADDAILLDNTHLNLEQLVERGAELVAQIRTPKR
ncbi:cytidylate kinase [Lewinella marina]|uniref:Cytidylate kinase n=1 Tax=Neolewinella marina TaxID=438751 RepID=A0A2G0CKP5_9BACT|nr:(d)CMP kinase [Neolewinella marina]NJB84585.1 cytidylate kinase [Neolewinella marina]PHL00544.1 cytidylate kinase [Neolewinella marina]